ncbi:hypothetical protein IAS59_001650 [Cryptococcus gattii]
MPLKGQPRVAKSLALGCFLQKEYTSGKFKLVLVNYLKRAAIEGNSNNQHHSFYMSKLAQAATTRIRAKDDGEDESSMRLSSDFG